MLKKNGGARPGAGRPAGAKNRTTRDIIEKAFSEGDTPLDYMLKVMRDENAHPDRRDNMAEKASQYIHPKLTAISSPEGGPVAMSLEVVFVGQDNKE